MFISKKELLEETKISYGQLYRWKREGLIPESWFIKKASFTGQETVFPKEKILRRIGDIQSMKNQYSLEELARILSPEVTKKRFTPQDLKRFDEISEAMLQAVEQNWHKDSYRYIELLIMIAICQCQTDFNLKAKDIQDLCHGIENQIDDVKHTDYLFILLFHDQRYFACLKSEESKVHLDQRLEPVKIIPLSDLSAKIKVKYRKRFSLKFEEDEETHDTKTTRKAVMA